MSGVQRGRGVPPACLRMLIGRRRANTGLANASVVLFRVGREQLFHEYFGLRHRTSKAHPVDGRACYRCGLGVQVATPTRESAVP